ncbi:MAG: UDP-N-acetylglucosamine 2-epimerase [Phycisphaerae bacterium]
MSSAQRQKRRKQRRRRVAVVTGTRAEYGLLRSTIEAIAKHPQLQLQLVVTGMHLLKKFGHTVQQIESDGWKVDVCVPMQRGTDRPLDQAEGLARGIRGVAAFLERAGTDVVLVLGDRIEAMAGALAATTTGRFVAHVHGGDVAPGDLDEQLRHSLTKLAHIHLAATRDAARRIIKMGERPEHVHVVGAPGLDDLFAIAAKHRSSGRGAGATGGLPARAGALIIQHAYGRAPTVEGRVMSAILNAVRATDLDAVIIYPNTDRGHSGVLRAIEKHARAADNGNHLRAVRSLTRDQYLGMLCGAKVLIGNSSSGVIEAPVAGTPSVNVGDRQEGRLRAGPSVIDAAESLSDIRRGLAQALRRRPRTLTNTPYGDGQAGRRIAAVLARKPLNDTCRRKRSTF